MAPNSLPFSLIFRSQLKWHRAYYWINILFSKNTFLRPPFPLHLPRWRRHFVELGRKAVVVFHGKGVNPGVGGVQIRLRKSTRQRKERGPFRPASRRRWAGSRLKIINLSSSPAIGHLSVRIHSAPLTIINQQNLIEVCLEAARVVIEACTFWGFFFKELNCISLCFIENVCEELRPAEDTSKGKAEMSVFGEVIRRTAV